MKICSVAKYFSVVARHSPPAFPTHHYHITIALLPPPPPHPPALPPPTVPFSRVTRVNFIRRVFIHGCIQIFSARGTCVYVRACVRDEEEGAELVSGIRGIGGKINNCRKGFIGLSSTRGVPSAPRENAGLPLSPPSASFSLLSFSLSPLFNYLVTTSGATLTAQEKCNAIRRHECACLYSAARYNRRATGIIVYWWAILVEPAATATRT